MRRALALLPLLFAAPIHAFQYPRTETRDTVAAITYPATDTVDATETLHGEKVADPYRWLENDVRNDPRVAAWVAAQNQVTDRYLATLPGRDAFKARLTQLFDYERFGVPEKKGGRYFYSRNSGLQNQAVLYVRDSLDGEGRVLIDPNGWSKDGATALSEYAPSQDGKRLVYGIQDGGSDWRTVRVLDVDTGRVLPDQVKWVKFSNLAWAKDGSGFYYSRFPAPAADQQFQALNENQAVYFHKLGTAQDADRLIYSTPETPRRGHSAEVSDDGRYLVVTTSEGTDNRYEVTLVDLTAPAAKPIKLVQGLENEWSYAGNRGTTFYWLTNKDAPRSRVVAMDIADPAAIRDVVPQDQAVLESARTIGGELVLSYLVDAKSEVRRYSPDGRMLGRIALPGIGTVAGISGDADDAEAFYAFTSFNVPTTIYRYDVKADRADAWATPKVAFDPSRYAVEQRFYNSKDGTRVPMFVVRRKDVTGPAPTVLWGYGGFNISYTPAFSSARIAWLEQGGVFALANIRGGGEYGKAWHDGGRLANKQNVFDDFIAAGEYLIEQGVTKKDGLAVQGGSNGGLLVGAVVNQRPDLFAAALPAVGVMDMLRFDRFTAGRYWVDDYGYPAKAEDFKILRAYSPYHNVRAGQTYPAILATTADTDDRVVPGHTFKYTAMLQASDIGPKPHLVRIETRAGHGSGKPTDKIIEETADLYAFAAKWTGLEVKAQ
ncbi:prolyl oligopeptidase family serine peptidase [Sphingomonas sp.]|uniref:prolyl oligopeptidase family serine peptidase n=1 Tax=Sphingomonas sp. TaxID=28214 RepID=UPI002C0B2098|nr:prolyl oligopeptidase family serine peptidase [Sphingomonas sp.]HTG37719.1 prolyl oligopeptidase family serine peptidase [Sphingomonas sp.]